MLFYEVRADQRGKPKRSRNREPDPTRPYVMVDRDRDLLQELFDCGPVETELIHALSPYKHITQTRTRLSLMYDHGYVFDPRDAEDRSNINAPLVRQITRKGVEALRKKQHIDDKIVAI